MLGGTPLLMNVGFITLALPVGQSEWCPLSATGSREWAPTPRGSLELVYDQFKIMNPTLYTASIPYGDGCLLANVGFITLDFHVP